MADWRQPTTRLWPGTERQVAHQTPLKHVNQEKQWENGQLAEKPEPKSWESSQDMEGPGKAGGRGGCDWPGGGRGDRPSARSRSAMGERPQLLSWCPPGPHIPQPPLPLSQPEGLSAPAFQMRN